jgi:hypothetical protein
MIGVRARRFAMPIGRATTAAVAWVMTEPAVRRPDAAPSD